VLEDLADATKGSEAPILINCEGSRTTCRGSQRGDGGVGPKHDTDRFDFWKRTFPALHSVDQRRERSYVG
jgi:hypothetical protein